MEERKEGREGGQEERMRGKGVMEGAKMETKTTIRI